MDFINKKLDWIINFTKIRKFKLKKRITVSVCFVSNEDHWTPEHIEVAY